MTTAGECMETDVFYCKDSDTAGDALRILVEKRVSGIPIVNDGMEVVGFVNDVDIMQFVSRRKPLVLGTPESGVFLLPDDEGLEEKSARLARIGVMGVAGKKFLVVNEDEDIHEVASEMNSGRFRKAAVVRDGKMVGILSGGIIMQRVLSEMMESLDRIEGQMGPE